MPVLPMPSYIRLHQLFSYREDGRLIYKPRNDPSFNARYAGQLVEGIITEKGYRRIEVEGKRFYEHRIIFKMHHGFDPIQVDHKNGVRLENRIENLREANAGENCRSTRRNVGASKYKGVSKASRKAGKWCARIKVSKKDLHLGTFDSEKAAAVAYDSAAKTFHGNFAVTNVDLGLL